MGRLIFTKRASSSTPEVGKVALYAKNDGKLYVKKEDGTESEVGSGGGGGGEPVDYPITLDKGGTGATTAQGALNALTNVAAASAGYVLTKVGSNVAWAAASNGSGSEAGLPNPAGSNANDVVVSNGNAQYTLVDDSTFVSAAGAVMKSSFPAKGSLVSGTGVGTTGFLQAGANGKVLAANSAAASGLEWQDRATLTGSTANAIPKVSGANALAASGVTIDSNNFVTFPARIDVNGIAQLKGNAVVTGYLDVAGSISVSGTVDGRDVGVDGAKLDGIKKDNTTATTDPGNSNNTSQGYAVGSRWINTSPTTPRSFVCTAATSNSATWKIVGAGVDGITKSELWNYGTNITPAGTTGNIKIGQDSAKYKDIVIGGVDNSLLFLGRDRPPGIETPVADNAYGSQFRVKDARGMMVGGYPVPVQALSVAAVASDILPGSTARLARVLDFGTTNLLPLSFGILQLRLSATFKFTALVNNALNTPQFGWFLSAGLNGVDPNIVLSGTTVLNDTGVVIANGTVASPVVLNPADGAAQNDECHVFWDILVDLSRITYNKAHYWAALPSGMVTAYNTNSTQGTIGDSKSYPVSFDVGTANRVAALDSNVPIFSLANRPRLAFWFMQTGVNNVNLNTNPDTYANNQATGISSLKIRAVGQFAPRLNRDYADLYTTQYLTPDGTLAEY